MVCTVMQAGDDLLKAKGARATTQGGAITNSCFAPAWWLSSPHLQTLWQPLFRRGPRPPLRRQRLELPDGDFLDLDWTGPLQGPTVLALHGLEGSVRSPYIRGLLQVLAARGWRAVLMHFRGCSGEPNRAARWYHSGETTDLSTVVHWLRAHDPHTPLAVVGYSLGGNVLLKWLGEWGARAPISAAVAVSVPFVLSAAAERLEAGFSRVYQWWLLRQLRASTLRKFSARPAPIDLSGIDAWRTFREFDDRVTAPLHGFRDVEDYYRRSSSRSYLGRIRVPTLILHACDDPFIDQRAIPTTSELSATTTLEVSAHGGHVGFVAGRIPGQPTYWLERRIRCFLSQAVATSTSCGECVRLSSG